MRKIVSGIIIISLFFIIKVEHLYAQYDLLDYFPLTLGASWSYEDNDYDSSGQLTSTETDITSNEAYETINGVQAMQVAYSDGNAGTVIEEYDLISADADFIYFHGLNQLVDSQDPDDQLGYTLHTPPCKFKRLVDVGETLTISGTETKPDGQTNSFTVTITIEGVETVTVPAGTFENCLKVKWDSSDDDEVEWEWWAEGVGTVKSSELATDGSYDIESLISYNMPENSSPDAPALVSPADGATGVSLTPELELSDFYDPDIGDTHLKTEWNISKSKDFSTLVLSLLSWDYLTALSVPDMALKAGNTYYWRARYYDDDHNDSQWSETFSFTVAASENDINENGIPDDLENTSVDLDNDGTADMEQETIKTLNTVVGNGQMGISIKESDTVTAIEEINSIDPDKISKVSRPDVGPLGLFSFRISVQNPGDMAEVTIYFSEPAPDDASWFIFDTVNGWTDYSSYSVFSEDRMSVTVRLWDGGDGDADGIANGVIVDPSALVLPTQIDGMVTDKATGEGIDSASITFDGSNTSLYASCGGYYFTLIPAGTFDFTISAEGYGMQVHSGVEIPEGTIVTLDIALSKTGLTHTQVSQLYVAIFGRASEGEGNAYWCSTQEDMTAAAEIMLGTSAAINYFGSTLNDNQAFIEFIYENTLGKTYEEDPDGVNYWVNELAQGKSKAQVVVALINAAMDPAFEGLASQDRFINRVEICKYSAQKIIAVPDTNDLSAFLELISGVTDADATVTEARSKVEQF